MSKRNRYLQPVCQRRLTVEATAAQSRAMSVSARARGQLEPSHAYCANWRLCGEHSKKNTVDLDHDDDPTPKRADQNLQKLQRMCERARSLSPADFRFVCWDQAMTVVENHVSPAASSWCQQPMTNGWRQLGTGKGW